MVRTQIQLTEEQVKSLKLLASSRHLSVAELIRQAVDSVIKSKPGIDHEEKKKRAMETVGRYSSGKQDVSEKHDKYLSEAIRK